MERFRLTTPRGRRSGAICRTYPIDEVLGSNFLPFVSLDPAAVVRCRACCRLWMSGCGPRGLEILKDLRFPFCFLLAFLAFFLFVFFVSRIGILVQFSLVFSASTLWLSKSCPSGWGLSYRATFVGQVLVSNPGWDF